MKVSAVLADLRIYSQLPDLHLTSAPNPALTFPFAVQNTVGGMYRQVYQDSLKEKSA